MERSSAIALFEQMHPGFFDKPYIRSIPKEHVYEEMTLDLGEFSAGEALPCAGIEFGFFGNRDLSALRRSVEEVDAGWVQYFDKPDDVYCAFDGDKVVSFCLLDDMGEHEFGGRRVRVAGPGCVGTIPAYRRRGIGLEMVRRGTLILKERGYDLSYIHYTGVGHWYAKLGYETLLKWNADGVIGSLTL